MSAPFTVFKKTDEKGRVLIGSIALTSRTKWETLDATIRRIFKVGHLCACRTLPTFRSILTDFVDVQFPDSAFKR